ncbi:conserved protein of unknown function [Pseudomonas sp. JV551A1]|uniref:Core-binding (CB) domain-containing protein n=1 Tax=Pseudomonas inefficax TaxID=2078786 RepID=A0AAQ1P5V3_9PSED|nr:hypothetical protein [Pseudomonas]SPO54160.1 conserved protein of unknown function [Pseudomonas sp. JV551A1]SPO60441.1 conserved protein of unknown function [Pseudomonas inefficax]
MGRRKKFIKTDLSVPKVEFDLDQDGMVNILSQACPPSTTVVKFGLNAEAARNFDFAPWYNRKIDPITYVCQRQIERFLVGLDSIVSRSTVSCYCHGGLRSFLEYCVIHAKSIQRNLTLNDINRNLIDGFIRHLAATNNTIPSQKSYYSQFKPVLISLGKRGIFTLETSGDTATFPRNPFPTCGRKIKGDTALSKRERQEFTAALRHAIKPIWNDTTHLTSELLSSVLLAIALHTGRNTTPLLEMGRECLQPHPKDDTVFLVLWKRRGYSSNKVALRSETNSKRMEGAMPTVRVNLERLIRRVMMLTEPLDLEAPDEIKGRIWLYRSRAPEAIHGRVTALQGPVLKKAIKALVDRYSLKDSDGNPLRITISRLRKTFANRIFDLTHGDILTTAAALGNTVRVTDQNYLAPGENARRNWKFMGELLVKELLTATIGATYKDTPMGNCTDPVNGEFAPKLAGAICMNFMNCVRCRNYAVTAEDLYKLFSFYFRVLGERSRMNKQRWASDYAHIPRLIDDYIIAEGLRRGTFKPSAVDAARNHARAQPHPFWSVDTIDTLSLFS